MPHPIEFLKKHNKNWRINLPKKKKSKYCKIHKLTLTTTTTKKLFKKDVFIERERA